MSDKKKFETVTIGQYLLAKNGNTRYIKLEAPRKGDNPFPITLNEGDVLYVSMFDDEFRAQYNIPDFVKGRIDLPLNETTTSEAAAPAAKQAAKPAKKKNSDGEVNF